MNNLRITSQLITYIFLFSFVVNISDVKSHIFRAKVQDECRENLEAINDQLKQDEDAILDKGQVEDYENCVQNVVSDLNMENTDDFVFLLDCYTNLMDYYDFVEPNQGKVSEYEEAIYNIL